MAESQHVDKIWLQTSNILHPLSASRGFEQDSFCSLSFSSSSSFALRFGRKKLEASALASVMKSLADECFADVFVDGGVVPLQTSRKKEIPRKCSFRIIVNRG